MYLKLFCQSVQQINVAYATFDVLVHPMHEVSLFPVVYDFIFKQK